MLRLVLAFAIAPIAPLLVLLPVTFAQEGSFASAGSLLFLCAFFGYPAALLLGLPLFLLHRKMQWLRWWQVTITAALIGALVPVILASGFAIEAGEGVSFALVGSLLGLEAVGAGVGALAGLSFWFAGLYRVPKHAVEP